MLAMEVHGRRYTAYHRPADFFQAWQQCRLMGGQLAPIESEQENSQVVAAIRAVGDLRQQWIIGGTDVGFDGNFLWIGLNQQINYANFFDGEPNNHNGGEDCLTIGIAGTDKWNDIPCHHRQIGFVCAFTD
uniref:C-type lectin domain-containing protein n=1 Tax=Anopheles minimus TaxID=112268 RepID=A0A182WAZ6_9DIPT